MANCPKCQGILEDSGVCSCGYNVKRRGAAPKEVNRNCPRKEHGYQCGKTGSMADSTNGDGPWYCSDHFWRLKGYPKPQGSQAAHVPYRDSWHSEKGLNYEPPKLEDVSNFKCTATMAQSLMARLQAGELGPRRLRQPGDDDEELRQH